MTRCCICSLPCPGTDAADSAWCAACLELNLLGAELKPLAWEVARRERAAARELVALTARQRLWHTALEP